MFCAPHYVVNHDANGQTPNTGAHTPHNAQQTPAAAVTASWHGPLSGTAGAPTAVAAKAPYSSYSYAPLAGGSSQHHAPAYSPEPASVGTQHREQHHSETAVPAASAATADVLAADGTPVHGRPVLSSAAAGDVEAAAGFTARDGILSPYPEAPRAPVADTAVAEYVGTVGSTVTAANSRARPLLPSIPPAAGPKLYPVDYWEDRYQLPFAAARSRWPDPALLHLLSQQSDCLYDVHLPAVLPPAVAAALSAADSSSEGAAAAAGGGDGQPGLLPLSVPESLQQYSSSCADINTTTTNDSSSSRLSGMQLLQIIRNAAAKTAALTAGLTSSGMASAPTSAVPCDRLQQLQQQLCCSADVQLSSRYLLKLACPQLMVGYQSELLQVPPSYLPVWRQLGFSAVGSRKTVIYTAVAPSSTTAAAAAFFRDLAAMYSCCQLGVMSPMQPTDGPPMLPAAAAAAGARQPAGITHSFPAGVGLLDSTAAAIIPVDTTTSSSSNSSYGPQSSGAGEPDSSGAGAGGAAGGLAQTQSCWLRNLAAAARDLQARLLLQPPDLLYPAPWVVPSPDLTQPQEASLVVFVVVPDDDVTVLTQEGGWTRPAAAAAVPDSRPQQHQQQQQRQQKCSTDILSLRCYETVARYLAPVTSGVTAGSLEQGIITAQHRQQTAAAAAAAAAEATAAGEGVAAAAADSGKNHEAAAGEQQQQQQDKQHGLDVVIQLVRQSAVLCPTESSLRGVAMSVFNKVRRRHSTAAPAADTSNQSRSQQHQQQPSQQASQQQFHPEHLPAATDAAAATACVEAVTSAEGVDREAPAVPAPRAAAAPSPGGTGDAGRVLAPWVLSSPTYTSGKAVLTPPQPGRGRPRYEPLITLAQAVEAPPPATTAAPTAPIADATAQLTAAAAVSQEQPTASTGATAPEPVAAAVKEGTPLQQQQQQQRQQQRQRTLHCCYFWLPQDGFSSTTAGGDGAAGAHDWLVLTWTDSRAGVLDSKLIRIPTHSLQAAADAAASHAATAVMSQWVCTTVLAECLLHAADISSSGPHNDAVITRLVISRLSGRLAAGEGDAWHTLLTALQERRGVDYLMPLKLCEMSRNAPGPYDNRLWCPTMKSNGHVAPPAAAATARAPASSAADVTPPQQQQQHTAAVVPAGNVSPVSQQACGCKAVPAHTDHQQQQHSQPAAVPAAAVEVWDRLLQHLAAGLAAATTTAAAVPAISRKRSRPGSTAARQRPHGSDSSSSDGSKPAVLSAVSVVTLLPDGPVYLGGSNAGSIPQQPLLLLPGLKQQQQQMDNGDAVTASVVLPFAAAAAADSLPPGERDTIRLLHIGMVAAAAAITPATWAAATSAVSSSRRKSAGMTGLARHLSLPARQDPAAAAVQTEFTGRDGFNHLTVSVPEQTAAAAAAGPTPAAGESDPQHDLSSVIEGLVMEQLSPLTPGALGLSPGAFLDSALEGLVASVGLDSAGCVTDDSAGANPAVLAETTIQAESGEIEDVAPDNNRQRLMAECCARNDMQQQQQHVVQAVHINGGVAAASTSRRAQRPSSAASVAAAAADLAALSVVGTGLHGLLGYDGCAAATTADAATAIATYAAGGLLPSPGSAVHLPMHAAAALRLWLLTQALDELAT